MYELVQKMVAGKTRGLVIIKNWVALIEVTYDGTKDGIARQGKSLSEILIICRKRGCQSCEEVEAVWARS